MTEESKEELPDERKSRLEDYDRGDSDVPDEAPALNETQDDENVTRSEYRERAMGFATQSNARRYFSARRERAMNFGTKGNLARHARVMNFEVEPDDEMTGCPQEDVIQDRKRAMNLTIRNNMAEDQAVQLNAPVDFSALKEILERHRSIISELYKALPDPKVCDSGIYHSLPSRDSKRLLEILPGVGNAPIVTRVHVTKINDQSAYEALSYVWGREANIYKIEVNNHNVDVAPNLFHALERIRLQDRPRFIWVDKLCINQSDNDEKAIQVRLMSQIYRKARRVLVWLGKDDEGNGKTSAAVFTLVCEVVNYYTQSTNTSFISSGNLTTVSRSKELPEVNSQRWIAFQKLFGLEWFWRVWVIQEIALSATASLLWGDCEIAWECVGVAAAYIRIHGSNIFEHFHMPGVFNAYFMYRISIAASPVFEPVSLSFLRLLTMTQQYQASDPRDRVYGLLGLPSSNSNRDSDPFIEPNYNLDVRGAYKAVALKIIGAEGNLSLLSSVQHGPEINLSQSSWVPMWNTAVFTQSLVSADQTQQHKADGGIPMDRSEDGGNGMLRVRGLDVGEVASVLPLMKDVDFRSIKTPTTKDTLQWNNQLLKTVLQASDDKILLSYTLTAGKDWYGLLVRDEEAHLADFTSWVFSRVNLFRSESSVHPEEQAAKSETDLLENDAEQDDIAARFSEQTLRPHLALSATRGNQQNFRFFPRFEHEHTNVTETSDPEYFEKNIDEEAHLLVKGFQPPTDHGKAWRFAEASQNACTGRRLFFTKDGNLGLGPAAMREGDHLCILFGGSVPFILRPDSDRRSWRLIGECYVKKLVKGQGVEKYKEGLEDSILFNIL